MAFQLYNWSEVSSSLNQGIITADIASPSGDTSTRQGSMNIFSYFSTTDTIAQISASGYFLPQVIDLLVGDIIFVTSQIDGPTILQVLTSVPPTDITSGSITTTTFLRNPALTQYTATSMTNTQLLGMFAAPVQLVPAQGPGTLIVVDKMLIDYAFLTAATAGGGAIQAQYSATINGAGPAATASIAAATLNGFAGNASMIVGGAAVSQLDTAVYNTGIYLSNATGAFTTGAGSATVYLWYRVLTPA